MGHARQGNQAEGQRQEDSSTHAATLLSKQRQKRPELDLGLGQLGRRVGAGDDADAGEEVGLAVAEEGAAEGDAEFAVLGRVHPADGGGVPAAVHALELGDRSSRRGPGLAADGVELGTVNRVQDNAREHIFDGIVVSTPGGRVFVDAPEIARITEKRVTLTIDAAEARSLPEQSGGWKRWFSRWARAAARRA